MDLDVVVGWDPLFDYFGSNRYLIHTVPPKVVVLVLAFMRSLMLSEGSSLWAPGHLLDGGGRQQGDIKEDSGIGWQHHHRGSVGFAPVHEAVEAACMSSGLPLVLIPVLVGGVSPSIEAVIDTATSVVKRAVGSNRAVVVFKRASPRS